MDALRAMSSPTVRHFLSFLQTETFSPDETMTILREFPWHDLLRTPGVAAALGTACVDAIRPIAAAARSSSSPAAVPLAAYIHWGALYSAVLRAASVCSCADDALVDALLPGIPVVAVPTPPADVRATEALLVFCAVLDNIVGSACEAALPEPLVTHPPRERPGCRGRSTGAAASSARAPSSVAPIGFVAARARVARLAANVPLMQLTTAFGREVVRLTTDPAPRYATARKHPFLSNRICVAAQVWVEAAPRQLLAVEPDVLSHLLDDVRTLCGRPSDYNEWPIVKGLLASTVRLAEMDPPRLRALPQVPDVIAAAASYVVPVASLDPTNPFGVEKVFLRILSFYSPGGAVRMASCPALVTHMTRWATIPSGTRPTIGKSALLSASRNVASMASALVLYMCHAALRSGQRNLPGPLRTDAARTGWARVAAVIDDSFMASVGTQMVAMTGAGFRAPRSRLVAITPPWAPAPFPIDAVMLALRKPRCWECGSTYRQPFVDYETPLRRCGGCLMAVFCSTTCAAASWSGGHKLVCRGWKVYVAYWGNAAGTYMAMDAPHINAGRTGRARDEALAPVVEDLSGDWRGTWGWPRTMATIMGGAKLPLSEVVAVIEPGHGAVEILPLSEYRHQPEAMPEQELVAASADAADRIMRVVYRQHPPLLRALEGRYLRLPM